MNNSSRKSAGVPSITRAYKRSAISLPGILSILIVLAFLLSKTTSAAFTVSNPSIAYYVNVTLTGDGGNYLTSNAVFNVLFNAGQYKPLERGDIRNIYIFDGNSLTTVNSWVEGSLGNELITASGKGGSNLNQYNDIDIWIQTSNSFVANGAVQTNDIQIGFGPLTSNYMIPGNNIGEAPYLSNSQFGYAKYDYGANVFSFYERFGGLASNSLPTAPVAFHFTGGTANIIDFANSMGIQQGGSAAGTYVGNSIYSNKTGFASNTVYNVMDFFIGQIAAPAGTNSFAVGQANNIKTNFNGLLSDNASFALIGNAISSGVMHINFSTIGFKVRSSNTLLGSAHANSILTIGQWATGSGYYLRNYSAPTIGGTQPINAISTAGSALTNTFVMAANSIGNTLNVSWIRARPIPTNLNGNSLPIASFSALQAVPATVSVAVANPANSIADVGQYEVFTATTTNGVSTFTYVYNTLKSQATGNKAPVTQTNPSAASGTSNTFGYLLTSSDAGLQESANVLIKDSSASPVVVNSVNTLIYAVNSAPTATIGTGNTLLDSGQYYNAIMVETGGSGFSSNAPSTGGFQIEFTNITSGQHLIGANVITWSPGQANSLSANQVTSSTNNNQFSYCGILTDKGTTTPFVFNPSTVTITVNAVLAIPAPTFTNTIMDSGQWTTLKDQPTGGTFPFTYNEFNTTGALSLASNSAVNARLDAYTFKSGAAGTFSYKTNITDSASTAVILAGTAGSFAVNSAPTATVSFSNSILDSGQWVAATATESGGSGFSTNAPATGGFTINAFNVSAGTSLAGISNVLTWTPGQANTFAAWKVTNGGASMANTINVVVTDKGTTTPFVFNSVGQGTGAASFSVNSAPSLAIALSNTILDSGQWVAVIATESGGSGFSGTSPATGGFTFNVFNVSNSFTQVGIANVITWSPGSSNTFTAWKVFNTGPSTANTVNAVGTDKGTTTPYIFNSIHEAFSVNSAPTISLSTSNTALDAGQYLIFTVTGAGGSGPKFNTELYNISSSSQAAGTSNVLILSVGGSNTLTARVSTPPGWSTSVNALPAAVGGLVYHSCTESNGNIQCMGGFGDFESYVSANVFYANVLSNGDVGPWSTSVNALATSINGLFGQSCTEAKGYIQCIDGSGGTTSQNSANVFYANVLSNGDVGPWSTSVNTLAPSLGGLIFQSCTELGGNIQCIGGEGEIGHNVISSTNVFYANVLSNGDVGPWSTSVNTLPATTNGLSAQSCTESRGNIQCMGGIMGAGTGYSTNVFYANVLSNGDVGPWSTSVNTLYSSMGGIQAQSCTTYSGYIYCMDGEPPTSEYTNNVSYAKVLSNGDVGHWFTSSNTLNPGVLSGGVSGLSCTASGPNIDCVGGISTTTTVSNTLYTNAGYIRGAFQYNATSYDEGTTTPYVFNSMPSAVSVEPALTTPTLLLPNTILDVGQYVSVNATTSGGTFPLTFNAFNTTGSVTQTSNSIYTESNTLTFLSGATGSFSYKTNITDSATFQANKVSTALTFSVNSAPTALLSFSNTLLDSGQYYVPMVTEAGGSGYSTNSQLVTILHNFAGTPSDGASPQATVVVSGSTLYGMTYAGGTSSDGTIYSEPTSGGTPTILHNFAGGTSDGAEPDGYLILSGSTLYGMTYEGGTSNNGIIFSISTGGSGYNVIHNFAGGSSDGAHPYGSLVISGSTLYGMTSTGGSSEDGVIFAEPTSGAPITILHSFAGGPSDGASPTAPGNLSISGSTLYGTTYYGGVYNTGVIFSEPTSGGNPTILYSFPNLFVEPTELLLSGSTLYGTTVDGDYVYSEPTSGGTPTILYDVTNPGIYGEAADGPPVLSGGRLYIGMPSGGSTGDGTIISISANGGNPTLIDNVGGPDPIALSGSTIYSVQGYGGTYGFGLVFSTGASPPGFPTELTNVTTTGNKPAGANVLIFQPGQANSLPANQVTSSTNNNQFTYCAIITDQGTSSPYVFSPLSNSFTVNTVLGTPTISFSQPSNTVTGNTITFTSTYSGGTLPYTLTYTVANTVSKAIFLSNTFTIAKGTSNTLTITIPANWIANQLTVNALITDDASTPVTQVSANSDPFNVIVPYTPPTITSISSPSNTILDVGQATSSTVTVSNGAPNYAYAWNVVNTLVSSYPAILQVTNTAVSVTTNTLTFKPTSKFTTNSPLAFNVAVQDSNPTTINSVYSANFAVNSAFQIGVSLQNSILDSGQWVVMNIDAVGGSGYPSTGHPSGGFTFNLINVSNSGYQQVGVSNVIAWTPSGVTNTFVYQAFNTGPSTTNTIETIGTDLGTTTPFVVTSSQDTFAVNSAPTVTLALSNTLLDSGQYLSAEATEFGGSGFSANAPAKGGFAMQLYNVSNSFRQVGLSNVLTWTPGASNTFAAYRVSTSHNGNTNTLSIIGTDEGTTTPFIFNSVQSTIAVNTALASATPTLSNTILDAGQWAIATESTSNYGTLPIKYIWNISNSVTPGTFVLNTIYSGVESGTNAIGYQTGAGDAGQTEDANVLMLDSASTQESSQSGDSAAYSVNSAPTVTLSLSNTLLDSGQWLAVTATESGGSGFSSNAPSTGGFQLQLYNVSNSFKQNGVGNVLAWTPGQANTFAAYQVASTTNGNAFTINAVGTDKGTTTPYVFNSVHSTITVNAALSATSVSSSNSVVNPGQYQTLTLTWSGGTQPYTANFLVVNTISGVLLANALYTGLHTSSSTFSFAMPANGYDYGTIEVVGNVLDSASTPVNVIVTNTITVTGYCTVAINPVATTFGSVAPQGSYNTNTLVTDTNYGSVPANIMVYGTSWSGTGSNTFQVSNTLWSAASQPAAAGTRLTTSATDTYIDTLADSTNDIYFGLTIPPGQANDLYTQTITLESLC